MSEIKRVMEYKASPSEVFAYLDYLGVTGMHMTKSSMPMMGSKLTVDFLSKNHSGLNSKYRWTGKIIGVPLDFTVVVTKWSLNEEKVWETIGNPKLIIYSWFRMHLKISPGQNGTQAHLSISYGNPKSVFNRILSFFLADWYCRWCLNNMLNDAKKELEKNFRQN